jgi:hypothetical protein
VEEREEISLYWSMWAWWQVESGADLGWGYGNYQLITNSKLWCCCIKYKRNGNRSSGGATCCIFVMLHWQGRFFQW